MRSCSLDGGTLVTLHGSGFAAAAAPVACRFNTSALAVPAPVGATALLCRTPPQQRSVPELEVLLRMLETAGVAALWDDDGPALRALCREGALPAKADHATGE